MANRAGTHRYFGIGDARLRYRPLAPCQLAKVTDLLTPVDLCLAMLPKDSKKQDVRNTLVSALDDMLADDRQFVFATLLGTAELRCTHRRYWIKIWDSKRGEPAVPDEILGACVLDILVAVVADLIHR